VALILLFVLFFINPVWSEVVVIQAKWMIDVETGALHQNPVIVIRDGKFAEIGTTGTISIPEGATTVNLGNSTLLPGLIDAHAHLAWKQADQDKQAGEEEALKTLLAGFTTVRNPGSTGKSDILLRDSIQQGKLIGPRILAAGPALGTKGGVCDRVFAGEGVVNDKTEATNLVAELARQKADLIKFCAGGGVIPGDQDQATTELDGALIQAIIVEARRHGMKVAAHAQGPQAILSAVREGVDSIEHGGLINEEAAILMKEKGTYLVPTLYRLDWLVENAEKTAADPKTLETLRTSRTLVFEHIRKAIELDVPVAFGTDATVYPHGLNAREFSVLVKLGMSPVKAIQTATIHAAKLLGLADQIGQIKAGMSADLIAVNENPLQDITALERVHFVMKEGKIYAGPEVP